MIGSEWVSSLGIFSIVHVNRFTASSSAVSLNILQFSQSSRVHVWTTALTLMNIQAQSDCFSQGIFTHVHWLATYHTLHRQLTAHLSKVAKELLISLQAHISLTEKMRCPGPSVSYFSYCRVPHIVSLKHIVLVSQRPCCSGTDLSLSRVMDWKYQWLKIVFYPILDHLAILFYLIPKSPSSERGKSPLRFSCHISPEALL